jgi:lipopolysaccharide assembly protein A
MRFVCFLLLLAFVGAVGIFAYQNQDAINVRFLNWELTYSRALVVGAAYVLGMLSGWTVVGMVRRSFERSSELLENRERARANY